MPAKRSLSAGNRRTRPLIRIVSGVLVLGALAAFVWFDHATVSQSVGIVERAGWGWLLAACAFELLSMMAFARTQRIVLRATGVHASIRSVAATALVGNAISVSVPIIGPGAGSVFTYSRFRQVADDPAPVTWTLLISGLISNLAFVLLVAIGATVSGNAAAILSGVIGGAGVVLITIIGVVALRQPRSRRAVIRAVARLLRVAKRFSGRPVGDPENVTRQTFDALSAFRMRARDWVQTIGLSVINWIASVSCFVAAILAVGSNVPWTRVILVYCAGATASSFNLTPGGLGVTEAVLTAGLVASGMRPAAALGSALIFRLVSFWLVALVGWTIYSGLRRDTARGGADTADGRGSQEVQ
ncbi:MAG: YbhN family protein [Acidimicrobiales bacterium]